MHRVLLAVTQCTNNSKDVERDEATSDQAEVLTATFTPGKGLSAMVEEEAHPTCATAVANIHNRMLSDRILIAFWIHHRLDQYWSLLLVWPGREWGALRGL